MKPKVYVETSVISYLTSRVSRDLVVAAKQQITQDWWSTAAKHFEIHVSELVVTEASRGDAEAASRRLEALSSVSVLAASAEAMSLSELLVERGPIPNEYQADAAHVAIAAVNGLDYLLTWNCKHIANAAHLGEIEHLLSEQGYSCPRICTPLQLKEE